MIKVYIVTWVPLDTLISSDIRILKWKAHKKVKNISPLVFFFCLLKKVFFLSFLLLCYYQQVKPVVQKRGHGPRTHGLSLYGLWAKNSFTFLGFFCVWLFEKNKNMQCRAYMAHKPKIFTIRLFTEKFANLKSRKYFISMDLKFSTDTALLLSH